MNEILLQIVLDSIAFVALSDDDTVNQDAAVEQLEHIAALLKSLPAGAREEFLAFVGASAARARQAGEQDRAEFLEALPAELGIDPA